MTITELRNTLAADISAAIGIPVLLANQVQPETKFPFAVYSVTSPYTNDGEEGDYSWEDAGDTQVLNRRREQPIASLSYTVSAIDRWADADRTVWSYGDDEAAGLADKMIAYLQQGGYNDLSNKGIVVVGVENVGDRSAVEIDQTIRRYGFDVRVRYTRTDERMDDAIAKINVMRKGG